MLLKKVQSVSVRRLIRNELKRNLNQIIFLEGRLDLKNMFQGGADTDEEIHAKIKFHETVISAIKDGVLHDDSPILDYTAN